LESSAAAAVGTIALSCRCFRGIAVELGNRFRLLVDELVVIQVVDVALKVLRLVGLHFGLVALLEHLLGHCEDKDIERSPPKRAT